MIDYIFKNEEAEINFRSFWVRFIFLLIPNIVDLILTILNYDSESKI